MKPSICLLLLVTLISASTVFSQHIKDSPKVVTALKAARLLDVRRGSIITNAVVLIENGRTTSVGSNIAVPAGYTIIDLGDVTLLPGLIDCHTHLLHSYDQNVPNSLEETSLKSTADRALLGTVLAQEMLKSGFTTVRDLGNSGYNGDVALRNAINAGYIIGPRMIVSTRALSPVGGQFGRLTSTALPLVKEEYAEIFGVEEGRRAVRQAIYDGANCIKVIANDMYQYLSKEELKAIVDEAHRLGFRVAAHATGGQAIVNCIEAGVNSIEHGYDLTDEELKKMADKKIFLVPTDEPGIPDQQKRMARAFKAGVPIANGSDVYTSRQVDGKVVFQRGERSILPFKAAVAAGLTPLQAIQTGTINAGELLGFSNKIGSIIEAGKPADIIAVKGDVLKDISVLDKVGFVMKEGQIFYDSYSKRQP